MTNEIHAQAQAAAERKRKAAARQERNRQRNLRRAAQRVDHTTWFLPRAMPSMPETLLALKQRLLAMRTQKRRHFEPRPNHHEVTQRLRRAGLSIVRIA